MPQTMERFDWHTEDIFWERVFDTRPYAVGHDYDYWRPVYWYGFDAANRYPDAKWEDIEDELRIGWEHRQFEHEARSEWEHVRDAVRDAWGRITRR